jgi:hypothetical protein
LHTVTAANDGFHVEAAGEVAKVGVIRHDFVPPVPEGTYIVMAFQVTGYGRDADGSALPELTHVGLDGKSTGWVESCVGLGDEIVILDHPTELRGLAQEK